MEKNILSSKQFWVAVVQGLLGIAIVIANIQPELGYIVTAKSILDIILRMLTTQPVEFGFKK